MKGYCITFRSVTYGQSGQRLLQKAGVENKLQRTPRHLEQRGCGYCLHLRPEQAMEAVTLLRQGSVPFRGVYVMLADGSAEEVLL